MAAQTPGQGATEKLHQWLETHTREIARTWDRAHPESFVQANATRGTTWAQWLHDVRRPQVAQAIVVAAVNERVISTNVALHWQRDPTRPLTEYVRDEAEITAHKVRESAQEQTRVR